MAGRTAPRTYSRVTLLIAVAMAVVTGLVAGWFLSSWTMSGKVNIDGRAYYSETVAVQLPSQGQNSTAPMSYVLTWESGR